MSTGKSARRHATRFVTRCGVDDLQIGVSRQCLFFHSTITHHLLTCTNTPIHTQKKQSSPAKRGGFLLKSINKIRILLAKWLACFPVTEDKSLSQCKVPELVSWIDNVRYHQRNPGLQVYKGFQSVFSNNVQHTRYIFSALMYFPFFTGNFKQVPAIT